MAGDVFLLGAGFSKAVSDHMPLMDELGRVPMFFHGELPAGLMSSTTFEELLTFLSQNQAWLSESQNLANRATFLETSERIAVRLRQLEARALSAPMPDWFRRFFGRLSDDQAWVISLNYDTLLEHAYTEELRQAGGELSAVGAHASIYAVPIPSALARTRMVLDPYGDAKTLRLVKLHGSVNWSYSGSEQPTGEEIFDKGLMPGWRAAELSPDVLAASIDKVSLLVPPTLGKSPYFVNETIRSLWRVAFRALREAERVFVLGYSLPVSDHNMLGLLRFAISDGQTVHVVNRSTEVGARYESLLGRAMRVDQAFADLGVEGFVADYLG